MPLSGPGESSLARLMSPVVLLKIILELKHLLFGGQPGFPWRDRLGGAGVEKGFWVRIGGRAGWVGFGVGREGGCHAVGHSLGVATGVMDFDRIQGPIVEEACPGSGGCTRGGLCGGVCGVVCGGVPGPVNSVWPAVGVKLGFGHTSPNAMDESG